MENENNLKKYINNIDLILPAYNEEDSIKKCINNFYSLKIFNKIIVIDNNSTDNTKIEIEKTKAIYIQEKQQGYGASLIRGFKESKSDYIITCEPDLTILLDVPAEIGIKRALDRNENNQRFERKGEFFHKKIS